MATPGSNQLEADIKQYHAQLVALGLASNPAAAYAMKWATRSFVPVSIKDCLSRCDEEPLTLSAAEALSSDFEKLFRNGDTLFLSSLVYSNSDAAAARRGASGAPPSGSGRLDMSAIHSAMQRIYAALQNAGLVGASLAAIKRLLAASDAPSLAQSLKWINAEAQAAILTILLLLPPLACVEHLDDVMAPLLTLMEAARHICAQALHAELKRLSPELMRRIVFVLQQFMTIRLYRTRVLDVHVSRCCNLLQVLHDANQQRAEPIDHTEFYNDVVNSPDFNLDEDFKRWCSAGPPQFCFCRFPFLYGPAAKARILALDCVDIQLGEIANAIIGRNGMPYLVLQVRRGADMIHDALSQIRAAMNADTLKKSLKVKFVGEQGVDEGGVAKEFFHLLMQQCFSPQFGMFSFCNSSRLHWFVPSTLADLSSEFELIGIMIGLAIFNSHNLEFSFPLAIYKKLLGRPVGLEDLKDLNEDVYNSLVKLLEYPGECVEEDMGLTFEATHEVDFCNRTEELIPGGASVAVTGANRTEFVERYVDFLLNKSIRTQFEAFRAGFQRLCSGAVLDMFNPQELELLICGSRELNFRELQRAAVYDGGYSPSDDVIQWFWKAVHEYDDELKKKLLLFVTSSHRVPINGLGSLSPAFCIAKNGGHTDRLPTAHTCFNVLLLPQYRTEADLRLRLKLALENAEGFGLM